MNRKTIAVLAIFFFCLTGGFHPRAEAQQMGIATTEHNLSVTGPGEIKALTETRICVFCHTPHNAAPSTPLWNRAIEPKNYTLYSSSTMQSLPAPPNGPSRLCLSCHDGTLALGAVLQPAGGIATKEEITFGRPSYIGTILSDDHPFSISYAAVVLSPYAGLNPALGPTELPFYGGGSEIIECSTCHDPHADVYRSPDRLGRLTGKFLVMDNRGSAFCVKCHNSMPGWTTSSHSVAIDSVQNVLPVAPRLWPTWPFVKDWGCESCHTPHTAGGPQRLLYYEELQRDCVQCHDGTVASDIKSEINKSGHAGAVGAVIHSPVESVRMMPRHVECVDCHNPHAANSTPAAAPLVSGAIQKMSGITADGVELLPLNQQFAGYEYEICFKCHADYGTQIPYIPRVVINANTRQQFDMTNPSYHPVEGIGRNIAVPSLIMGTLTVPSLNLTPVSIIYCSDCHDSNDSSAIVGNTGPRGPHGSIYPPILRERYETNDMTPESYQNYALCYRCHDRMNILSDASFQKKLGGITPSKGGHSGHLAAGAPCSVCHDAHGVLDSPGTGDHTNLINFDIRTVSPLGVNANPLFTDLGLFSGSCTLVCHGVSHNNMTYP